LEISIESIRDSAGGDSMKRIRFTVEPKGGDWVVRQGQHILSQHPTEAPAVQSGMRQAHAAPHSQLIIKKQNGQIQEERT